MRPSTSRFRAAMAEHYPGAVPQADFVESTAELLAGHGFTPPTALACVAVCRDELAGSLLSDVEGVWGPAFSMVSLAGLLTAGRTGFSAAAHHAPVEGQKRRLVLYAMAHTAISDRGVIGEVIRPGVTRPSRACGALSALQQAITSGRADRTFDPLDAEQSLLIERLAPASGSDLVELTTLAIEAIEDDAWELFGQTVGPDPSFDTATFTGVQVHGPGERTYVCPRAGYLTVDGDLRVVDTIGPSGDRSRTRTWLARGAVASTVVVLASARRSISPRVGL